jgi:hypothetical protein
MQSVEDFEPTGAFEAIKVLGRELQHSKERIKNLENGILEVSTRSMFLVTGISGLKRLLV